MSDHRLAAILSADVAGYTRLMSADEEGTVRTLTAYRDEISLLVNQHRGTVVDFPGDNLLAEFPTAIDAVRGAVAIQRVLAARNADLPQDVRMEFRIGVHLGDVRFEGDRVYGDGVNIAARLEGLAEPGGICISATVHEQVRNKLEVGYDDLGDQVVKNVPDHVHVYQVKLERDQGAPPTESKALWRPLAVVAVGVVLVGLGVLVWQLWPAPTATDGPPSLAVLPFDNMSGDPEQEYFSDGLTEDLITDLSKISGLLVIARNSAFTYKGRAVRVEDVGQELGVRYVLEGSVRRSGDRVRITAQLVSTEDGGHVWAERYDRRVADMFDLQDDVTKAIVAALEVHLSDQERAQVDDDPTEDPEAYDKYQRALVYGQQFGPRANAQAQALLEQAIERDPEFAAARSALARLLVGAWMSHYTAEPDTMAQAESLVDGALALDPDDVPSLVAAASVYGFTGRAEESLAAAERAVALSPSSSAARFALGSALVRTGRKEEGERELQAALLRDPFNPTMSFYLGFFLFLEREYEQAVEVLQRGIIRTPDFIGLHGMLAVTYVEMGRLEDARAEAAEVRRINPDFSIAELARRNVASLAPEHRARMLAAARQAGLGSPSDTLEE